VRKGDAVGLPAAAGKGAGGVAGRWVVAVAAGEPGPPGVCVDIGDGLLPVSGMAVAGGKGVAVPAG
jgi:hypothetical protein